MQAQKIDQKFSELARSGRRALLPYLTAGYPDLDGTERMLRRFDAVGVPFAELGFPFSDSIADGPVIQGSFHRVLANGFRIQDLFARVGSLRSHLRMALLAMVSVSIVRKIGLEAFVTRCRDSGFDGLIVPDVPLEEAAEVSASASAAGLKNVMLVAPTTPPERQKRIAALSTGFVYRIAVRGTTGERDDLPSDVVADVRQLREDAGMPVCVGFGISTPEHVRAVCRVADGAIVGSAIVRRITQGLDAGESADRLCDTVAGFVEQLMTGTFGE